MAARVLRLVPAAIVLLLVAVALVLIANAHWRKGASTLALATGIVAMLRLFLARENTPMLAVRGRAADVLTAAALTALLMLTAWTF